MKTTGQYYSLNSLGTYAIVSDKLQDGKNYDVRFDDYSQKIKAKHIKLPGQLIFEGERQGFIKLKFFFFIPNIKTLFSMIE